MKRNLKVKQSEEVVTNVYKANLNTKTLKKCQISETRLKIGKVIETKIYPKNNQSPETWLEPFVTENLPQMVSRSIQVHPKSNVTDPYHNYIGVDRGISSIHVLN